MARVTFRQLEIVAAEHGLKVSRVQGNQGPYLWFTRRENGIVTGFTVAGRLNDRSLEQWKDIIARKTAQLGEKG